jgi:hypothetical protein
VVACVTVPLPPIGATRVLVDVVTVDRDVLA